MTRRRPVHGVTAAPTPSLPRCRRTSRRRAAGRHPGRLPSPAGGVAGIKASGRPDLAIVATLPGDGGSGGRGRGLHAERVRGRARPAVAGAPRGRPIRPASGAYGWPRRSSRRAARANAATGAGRRRRPGRDRRAPRRRARRSPERDAPPLDRDHRHAAAARHGRSRASTRSRRALAATDDGPRGRRGGPPDDRHPDEDRDRDDRPARSRRPGGPLDPGHAASPRASG